MLVLSRKLNEKVVLTDRETGRLIGEVVVVAVDRGKVRIGFEFDRSVTINRQEVQDEANRAQDY